MFRVKSNKTVNFLLITKNVERHDVQRQKPVSSLFRHATRVCTQAKRHACVIFVLLLGDLLLLIFLLGTLNIVSLLC